MKIGVGDIVSVEGFRGSWRVEEVKGRKFSAESLTSSNGQRLDLMSVKKVGEILGKSNK